MVNTETVKRYEAVDMNEALRMVKRDLGPDAVILSSRRIPKGAGSFGLFGRQVIEVTAAAPAGRKKARPSNDVSHVSGVRNTGASAAATLSMEPVIEGIDDLKKRLAALGARDDAAGPDYLADEVRELKSMVSYLLDQSKAEKERGLGRNYFALSRILSSGGLSPEHVQAIVDEMVENSDGGPEPDLKTLLYVSASKIRRATIFDGWIDRQPGDDMERNVVALVGPTGVGKTTTVAKLAANLTHRGLRVGLVTIDTYRIAAVEQLKIYANILKIPLEVVLSPGDLIGALNSYRKMDVVLIDTAGRSQRDTEQIEELGRFFDKVPELDARLTLSAASSGKQMQEAVTRFSRLPVCGLIFTKLDEAASLGEALSLQLRSGLPVSYLTTGQKVPEDIEEASAGRIINGFFNMARKNRN